jgi:hypothetical protein
MMKGMNRPGAKGGAMRGGEKSTKKKSGKDAAKPGGASEQDQGIVLRQSDFTLEFVWVEKPDDKREPVDPTLPSPTQGTQATNAPVPGSEASPTGNPAPDSAAAPNTAVQPGTPDPAVANPTDPADDLAPAVNPPPAADAPPPQ